jgi:hypothetical protein
MRLTLDSDKTAAIGVGPLGIRGKRSVEVVTGVLSTTDAFLKEVEQLRDFIKV